MTRLRREPTKPMATRVQKAPTKIRLFVPTCNCAIVKGGPNSRFRCVPCEIHRFSLRTGAANQQGRSTGLGVCDLSDCLAFGIHVGVLLFAKFKSCPAVSLRFTSANALASQDCCAIRGSGQLSAKGNHPEYMRQCVGRGQK